MRHVILLKATCGSQHTRKLVFDSSKPLSPTRCLEDEAINNQFFMDTLVILVGLVNFVARVGTEISGNRHVMVRLLKKGSQTCKSQVLYMKGHRAIDSLSRELNLSATHFYSFLKTLLQTLVFQLFSPSRLALTQLHSYSAQLQPFISDGVHRLIQISVSNWSNYDIC